MGYQQVCQSFGEVLGFAPKIINGNCGVQLLRIIPNTIMNRRAAGPQIYPAIFTFGKVNRDATALNLGVLGLLQEELEPVLQFLRQNNFTLAPIQNHWVFQKPLVIYIHWQSIENPIVFALKSRGVFQVLKNRNFVNILSARPVHKRQYIKIEERGR
ncbi:DUF1259 domain-containing protein [Mechercharimyces sp. CAU 1602]|uniref:DUF1259 domain-containing protein n=1 Tax=Mechercharimyces sp. CAU 1602 TaxID=2973933 RepID=UPI002162C14C|nr:DUF1259 domain-containing protein [Mechercharimyces sp. CAU 1602]MCS1352182.1 DUF1259 domain-containing protein [Mechercharimyces sp. CAU 1602]